MVNIIKIFFVGLCIGSFLNVVIYRLPNDLSIIKPRSFCPKCKNQINWVSNIPVFSWLIQKGKCKYCKESISPKYLLIELLTGLLFIIFSKSSPFIYKFSSNLIFEDIFSWIFLSTLLAISFIDWEYLWIPQSLVNFGFLFGFLNLLLIEFFKIDSVSESIILKGLLSSLAAYFLFETLRILSKFFYKKDAIGKGDSKLISMIALWLGPMGTLLTFGISYVAAAIWIVFSFKVMKIKNIKVIPFAPFLSIGGLIVWFFGNQFLIKVIY